MTKTKLFCFPYAGGAAASYNQWKPYFDPDIEFRPIELAARGRRMREANYASIDHAVDDALKLIKDELLQGPYALCGHSMGSMIAFELAYKILKNNYPAPVHIIFSGRAAPQINREKKRRLHHLPDPEFKKELLGMGGTPKEFFEHPELLEVFLPLLKGDFRLTETYVHAPKDAPLDCNITVMSGKKDEDSIEEVEAWTVHSSRQCNIHYFEGGHFFIHEEPQRVVEIINTAIRNSGLE
ncbi:MAG: thioesterase II family protein [Candidatus Omnitrophota bacterium]